MTNQQPNGQTTSLTQNSRTRQITLIGLMTAITCILAPLSIPLPFSPVPISLTNLVIFISVFILGMKDATISFLIYLLLGAVGLPVFASFHAGLSVLAGPTGGYLIGFIPMAIIAGLVIDRYINKRIVCLLGMIAGTAVCYLFGTAWLAYQANMGFQAALMAGVIPFIAGDLIKMVLAMLIGPQIRSQLKRANLY